MRILAVAVLAAACVEAPEVERDPLNPYGPEVEPWLNQSDGTYQLLTSVPVSIGPTYDTDRFAAYVDHPGITMLALAEAAALPVLASLETSIPGITAQLPAWYDAELKNNALGILSAWGFSLASPMGPEAATLIGTLTIAGAEVRYQFDTITFDDASFPVGMRAGERVSAEPTSTFTATRNGGNMDLGSHDVVIAVRDYAHDYALTRAPTNERALLGQATQCPLVALAVASKCEAGGCVAVLPQLTELCERGLDELFMAPELELTANAHILGGTANLVDDNHDLVTDRLLGSWVSEQDTVQWWSADRK